MKSRLGKASLLVSLGSSLSTTLDLKAGNYRAFLYKNDDVIYMRMTTAMSKASFGHVTRI